MYTPDLMYPQTLCGRKHLHQSKQTNRNENCFVLHKTSPFYMFPQNGGLGRVVRGGKVYCNNFFLLPVHEIIIGVSCDNKSHYCYLELELGSFALLPWQWVTQYLCSMTEPAAVGSQHRPYVQVMIPFYHSAGGIRENGTLVGPLLGKDNKLLPHTPENNVFPRRGTSQNCDQYSEARKHWWVKIPSKQCRHH